MSFINRILFRNKKNMGSKAATGAGHTRSAKKWTRFIGVRSGLVFVILIGLLIIAMSSGAQELLLGKGGQISKGTTDRPTGGAADRSKAAAIKRKTPNFDIRYTDQENLTRVMKNSSLRPAMSDVRQMAGQQRSDMVAGLTRLKALRPDVEVDLSPVTGSVEVVRSTSGMSKSGKGRSGTDIVRDFITNYKDLYGLSDGEIADLNFIGESDSPSGVRMVRVEQMVNGRAIFQSETRFILTRDGQIVRSLGAMIPKATETASSLEDLLTPQDALRLTMGQMGVDLDAAVMQITPDKEDPLKVEINANNPNIGNKAPSKIVYFPAAPGVLIPAWSQIIFGTDADWYVLADARDGTILWRKNIRSDASAHDARFRVFVQADGTTPADSPSPLSPTTATTGSGLQGTAIAPTIVNMHTAMSAIASPNGWIDDCPVGGCTANETQTLGNNVLACMDRFSPNNTCDTDAASVLDGNGRPTGNFDANARNRDFLGTTPRDFQTGFLPPPQAGNPDNGQTVTGSGSNGTLAIDQFRRGAVTHMFYGANWYHDKLFLLGFNEAAGNFQQTNFSGFGLGNDRALVDVEDVTGTNNANFSTPPDGTSGRAQMYRFTGPAVNREGGLDAEVFLHELTHGTSNRLIGNGSGLQWDPGSGMGEGWSDFYALSLLNNTNADDPNGKYAAGGYATYKLVSGYTDNYLYGIRRFPYSTDHSINPMTWADVDDVTNNLSGGIAPDPIGFNGNGATEVHNTGEVWCLTLWGVRSRVIAANAGDVPTGNQKMLQVVTDALKLTPANPTYPQARDALIAADCAANVTCPNEASIWDGFADRGLGYGSSAPIGYGGGFANLHAGIHESFSTPFLDVVNPLTDVTINDTAGNNNGAIDQGETVKLTVKLTNPWRSTTKAVTSATSTLTTSTPGITISDNSSTYGAIAPQGTGIGDTFTITVAAASACGSSINFTLTTVSNLGTTATNFSMRIGKRSGTDPVVTYTDTISPALTIVNNNPRGVFHSMNVTDDLEINDINFRVDSITHPGVSDLTVMLKGPTGYGTDLISVMDGVNDFGGTTITNMVIDDDVPLTVANDMTKATSAAAPYTKSWSPSYNSAGWNTTLIPGFATDPVGELSRFDGTSTKGTWTALVADNFSSANGGEPFNGNGTFGGWSIQVTPTHFGCSLFTAAGVSVSGRVLTADGRGLRNATVVMTDSHGVSHAAITSSFGTYQFDDVQAGDTYIMGVASKHYRFASRVVTVTDQLTGVDFTGDE